MTEAVAPARRALPPGGVVPENYFDGEGGAPTKTSLLDLFEQGKDTLFICSMMFPRAPTKTRRAHRAGATLVDLVVPSALTDQNGAASMKSSDRLMQVKSRGAPK